MPQHANGIDVSAEEERYLRAAFRRFAIPYVLAFALLAWLASWLGGSDAGGASPETVSALEQEVAGLRESLASLEERLGAVGAGLEATGGRVAALEERKPSKTADPGLERKLAEATRRVNALEKEIAEEAAGERLDALASRMTKLERQRQAAQPASPAPAAPAPAPPPTSGIPTAPPTP